MRLPHATKSIADFLSRFSRKSRSLMVTGALVKAFTDRIAVTLVNLATLMTRHGFRSNHAMLRIYSPLASGIVVSALCLSVMARSAGAGQNNATSACTLLSQAEIEQAVGAVINSGENRLTIDGASACRFTIKGGGLITVVVRSPSRPDWISEQIARMASHPQRFHEVNGIGDRSFLLDMTEKAAALCVFHADHFIQVSAFGVAQPSKFLPALVALVEKVVSRHDIDYRTGHRQFASR
jgi:hypothetical protein